MTHKLVSHESGLGADLQRARALGTIQFPAMQAVVSKELGPRTDLRPPFLFPLQRKLGEVRISSTKYNPFNARNPNADGYKVARPRFAMGVDWSRMDRRRSLLALVDDEFRRLGYQRHQARAWISYYQTASH